MKKTTLLTLGIVVLLACFAHVMPATTLRKSETACRGYIDANPWRLEPQIFNGEPALAGTFPHMAALGYPSEESDDFEWNCGGSLISSSFVLTAAHCVHSKMGIQPRIVRLGQTDLNADDADDYDVAEIIVHDAYNSTFKLNDIALLKLNGSVAHHPPACLYHENDNPARNLIVTGWGLNETGGARSNTLQQATLRAISNDLCAESYEARLITTKHICAKAADDDRRADTCTGDSGGPLQFQAARSSSIYSIVGVTSFGRSCQGNHPGVYTRVNSYLSWIEKYVWP